MSCLPAVVSGSTFEHNLLVIVKHQCKWSSLPVWCSRHIVADGRLEMALEYEVDKADALSLVRPCPARCLIGTKSVLRRKSRCNCSISLFECSSRSARTCVVRCLQ